MFASFVVAAAASAAAAVAAAASVPAALVEETATSAAAVAAAVGVFSVVGSVFAAEDSSVPASARNPASVAAVGSPVAGAYLLAADLLLFSYATA